LDYGNHDIGSLWSANSAIRNMIRKTTKKKQSWYNDLWETFGLTRYAKMLYNTGGKRGKSGKDIQNEEKFSRYNTRLKEAKL